MKESKIPRPERSSAATVEAGQVGSETPAPSVPDTSPAFLVSGAMHTLEGLTLETVQDDKAPALPYPVVGFGASAGGLTAFRDILQNLSPDTGMAFVLVTHLSPDHESYLTEIVEHFTRMPVSSAENGTRPEPNHVYILLPNQILRMKQGMFEIEERTSAARPSPVIIDEFFRSLAADQKGLAVGVVLSGVDSDGASGLKTIKGEGGIALVQSPETAAQPGMPQNSIAADHVDLVIPPAEIALELARLGEQFSKPEARSLENADAPAQDEAAFQRILQLIRTVSGIDFRQYKPDTIRRRLARRMVLLRKADLHEYFRFLQARPDEARLLKQDLLINVTRFFRDPELWEHVRDNVCPELVRDPHRERPIRIWCAGCASGEEAYSLAIAVLEHISQEGLEVPVQVFGTDLSEQSIETARTAIYPETLANEISPERLRRFFVKVDRGYQVSKRVRDLCIFAHHNLATDPPFSHIDILSCRNVMIYFNQALQRQVIQTFYYALEPGGFILLGMSEGLREISHSFSTVDRELKIYKKTGSALSLGSDEPRMYDLSLSSGRTPGSVVTGQGQVWPELELQRAADRIVLTRFGPPGLIVDERMNVLQSRGQMARFMEITPGGVSWNLVRVLREGVAQEVREAVQRAIESDVPGSATAVLHNEKDGEQRIRIEVLPITSAFLRTRCFLILFQTDPMQDRYEAVSLPNPSGDEKDRVIAQLRRDLGSTRFHLQSLIEERDARNQELVAANEEIQSANEELQSTNEELETTKEELQSANEELQTVNDELQQRNNILTQTGNDLNNLLNSVDLPLLMLTSDLRIRQFTLPMQRLLSVRPSDIGRSISEIRLQLSLEDLEPILTEVLETLGTRELEVQERKGKWYLLRVRPYRTADNKIEGLVVLLLDIDQLRRSQQMLLQARDFAGSVLESVPVPIVVLDSNFDIRTSNSAFRALSGLPAKDLDGRSLPDLVHVIWGIEGLHRELTTLAESAEGSSFELEHEAAGENSKVLHISGKMVSSEGQRMFLLKVEDNTVRRAAERLNALEKEALESEVEAAQHTLSRTREELRALAAHLFNVQEEERKYVARELHDDIGQRLSLIEILMSEVDVSRFSDEEGSRLAAVCLQIHELNDTVRQISHSLHPAILKDLGLSTALKALVEEFGRREGMPVTFLGQNLPETYPEAAETALYRITQEALRNVAKHAGKTHVKVVLEGREGNLELRVMDFGLGFDGDAEMTGSGLGMISMQERARMAGGVFWVQSSLGNGTTVSITIPVE